MEYKKQELVAWALSGQFETIENFKITKPSWKKSFWDSFFLSSVPSLTPIEETITDVLDIREINWTDFVLSNPSWDTLKVHVNGSEIYSWTKGESEKALSLRGWYNQTLSWTITQVWEEDPIKDENDVFAFWYIKLQLDVTPNVGDYVTFTSDTTNLQWISTEIHYIQWGFCYIRWTNLFGTLPTAWESIVIHTKIWDVFVVWEKNKVVAIDEVWNTITLFTSKADDEIIDIEYFNATLFILTNNFVFYWRSLVNCNINVYPLDFFDNMWGWTRILWFGKHLILFWKENQIISPVNWTAWSLGYIANWLNFNHKLFSKYSALTDQWSLYILQDDKQFVKVDIISVANGEYDLQTDDAMPQAQWMLDEIEWDVYITKSDKYVSIINNKGTTTTTYNFNLSYQHWTTWEYPHSIRSIWDYVFWSTQFQYDDGIVDQEISFQLWGESLSNMKTCYFVKMTLLAEELRAPDYTLQIDKYISGMKYTKEIDLKDYPINEKILNWTTNTLWYEQFWDTPLSTAVTDNELGYIINVVVKVNETADMFLFTLKNKENKITYWGSIIWYKNWLPEVTAYNYINK